MANTMIEATAMPALKPVVCVVDIAGWVDVAAAAEPAEVPVCDVEEDEMWLDEMWLDEELEERAVTDLDVLVGELEVLEDDEVDVLEVLDDELEVLGVEDAITLGVVCAAADDVEELEAALELPIDVTPTIVCASPSGMENVPSPVSQSQFPASTED